MITQASNQASKLKVVPHFGDVAMIIGFIHSKIWQQFYLSSKKPYWTISKWFINAKIEMFALSGRSILRYNHGSNTTGVMMSIWALAMMIAFNAAIWFGPALTFIPFISPILVFIFPKEVFNYITVEYRSPFMLGLMITFVISQSVHIIMQNRKTKMPMDKNKRGQSLIMLCIPERYNINEYWVQCIVEPLLIAGIGYGVFLAYADMVFFAFMICTAVSIMLQEMADGLFRAYHARR